MISFKEWQKKIQLQESPMAPAPVKEPKTVPTRPEKPKEDEWSPKPAVVPQPKNRKMVKFREDYERDVHPTTKEFWGGIRRKNHVFAKHPILAQYGDEMSKKSWDHLQPGEEGNQPFDNMRKCMGYIMQVERIESRHKKQLEELAVELTEKLWGIPSERLEANLTGMGGSFDKNFESDEDYENSGEISPSLRDEINKRITMNLLVHGSSMHTLKTAHAGAQLLTRNNIERFIDQELDKIDPNLVKLYNKIAEITGKQFWLLDIGAMAEMGLGNAAVASSRVDYSKDNPKVIAKGLIFPFLVHELFKGTAELLTHFGLEDLGADDAKKVINKADDIRHEPYLAMAGPALWRKLLPIKPASATLASIMKKFAKMPPKQLHDFLSKVWEADPDEVSDLKKEFEEILEEAYHLPEVNCECDCKPCKESDCKNCTCKNCKCKNCGCKKNGQNDKGLFQRVKIVKD